MGSKYLVPPFEKIDHENDQKLIRVGSRISPVREEGFPKINKRRVYVYSEG